MAIDSFTGDYECFSNFARMIVPGNIRRERFFYTEVAFQAMKAADMATFTKIMLTNDPAKAKKMGRKLRINVANWDSMKLGIMYTLLEIKFWSNPGFGHILRDTGRDTLIEGNTWHDNYWGDCHCPGCNQTRGKNMLGKLLMRVRTEIQTYYPGGRPF